MHDSFPSVLGFVFLLRLSLSFFSPSVHLKVNSDKIYWQRNADGTFSQIYSETKTVGHNISTKAVGSDERSDITHLYKHPEGIIKQNAQAEEFTQQRSKALGVSATKPLSKMV